LASDRIAKAARALTGVFPASHRFMVGREMPNSAANFD
jgi:hypothetical protein